MAEFKFLAKVGAVPKGEGLAFPLDGKMVALFNDDGVYRAIDDFCPHMGASLASGYVEDHVVICPWHAWRFNICDGTWCDNPKIKIDAYEVRVKGDEIQVRIINEVPTSGKSEESQSSGKQIKLSEDSTEQ